MGMITSNRLREQEAKRGPQPPRPSPTVTRAAHEAALQELRSKHAEEVSQLKAKIAKLETASKPAPKPAQVEEVASAPVAKGDETEDESSDSSSRRSRRKRRSSKS